MPEVTSVHVVVVAYRSAATLERCLRSVRGSTPAGIAVDATVVDNSGECDAEEIARRLGATFYSPTENIGFAAGCNLGARGSDADWLLLLNPDAWLANDYWERAAAVIESTDADILVPALRDGDGRVVDRWQQAPTPASEIIYALLGGTAHRMWTKRMPGNDGRYASGAALLIRRSAWEALAGLDERYFLFAEDADFFERARSAGLALQHEPLLQVTHLGSRGTASKTPFALMCLISGKVTFIEQRHGPAWARLTAVAYRAGAVARRFAAWLLRRGETRRVWTLAAAVSSDRTFEYRWMRDAPERALTVLTWPGAARPSVNPYVRELQGALEQSGVRVKEAAGFNTFFQKADVLHVHWPDALLNIRPVPVAVAKSIGLLLVAALRRLGGTRLTWTVHNLRPHEGTGTQFDDVYMWLWARMVDGYLLHTAASGRAACERYPWLAGKPSQVCHHPAYSLPGNAPETAASHAYPRSLVLSFGSIRPYKRLEDVLQAFSEMGDPRFDLRICGHGSDEDYLRRVRETAVGLGLGSAVQPGEVPAPLLARLVGSAALVVLPHEESLNSGSVVFSLTLGTPVLVPRSPYSEEIQDAVGSSRLHLFEGRLDGERLARALAVAAPTASPVPLPSWSDLAESSVSLWAEVLKSNGGQGHG